MAFYSKSLENLSQFASQGNGLAELKKIIAERKIRLIKKKQIIYYEGDVTAGIYLIISGKVKAIKLSSDGRELLTGMYGPEEYLGIQALLSNESYNETAEAVEDTTICLIPKDIVEQILNKYADVGRQFIKILSNNLIEKEEQLLQLAYHSVRKRMAQTLLKLASQSQPNNSTLRISREDLAAMAGMATETVSRTLSDFKEEGIIEKKGSNIDILDLAKLQKMKN